MRRLVTVILAAILVCACTDTRRQVTLDRAARLMDTRPDSSLLLLDSLLTANQRSSSADRLSDWPRRDRMRWLLLRTNAENKLDTVFRTDTLFRPVVDWYDLHGTPNERMLAHYLLGRIYSDMGEAPAALQAFHDAADCADTTATDCDYHQLMIIHGQMSELFQRQNLPKEGTGEILNACHYAEVLQDTVSLLIYQEGLAVSYYETENYDSLFLLASSLAEKYQRLGDTKSLSYVALLPIRTGIELHRLSEVKKFIDLFDVRCFDSNIPGERSFLCRFYCYHARYYLGIGMSDSAKVYASLAQSLCKDSQNYHCLYRTKFELYQSTRQLDSLCKYAELYTQQKDSAVKKLQTNSVLQTQGLYDYSRHQQMAERNAAMAERRTLLSELLAVALLFVVVLAYMTIAYIKRRGREKLIALNSQYTHYLQEYSKIKDDYERLRAQKGNLQTLIDEKEKALGHLRVLLSLSHEDGQRPEQWEMEDQLLRSEIVTRFHYVAARGQKAGTADWSHLREFVNAYMPGFLYALTCKYEKLNLRETNLCILIRLRFIPSEISILMDVSAQSLSNLRVRLLRRVFKEGGTAKDFNEHILNMDISGFSE